MDHIREGKHGARSTKQAIAIGLSKARRAGVKLPPPKAGTASARTRTQATRDTRSSKAGSATPHSAARAQASLRALKREGTSAASHHSLVKQAKNAASRRSPAARSRQAKRAARTRRLARMTVGHPTRPRAVRDHPACTGTIERSSFTNAGGSDPVPFSAFHPAVRDWFAAEIGTPTSAQLRGWDAIAAGRHTLIAAPTGSGKTLAAFLTTHQRAARREARTRRCRTRSASSTCRRSRRSAPTSTRTSRSRAPAFAALAQRSGLRPAARSRAAVRTGDTTPGGARRDAADAAAHPGHDAGIAVPAAHRRTAAAQMLRTVRTVIVDEIHAVIGSRRGAHLALTLERLAAVAERPLQRIGLSATQTPIEEVARFSPPATSVAAPSSTSATGADGPRRRDAALHARGRDVPRGLGRVLRPPRGARRGAPHDAVFVNTRRMAERRRAAPQRAARRRCGDGASRQPVEGEAARRRRHG